MSSNRRTMTLLFVSLVVVMLGFGLIIPIMPFYVASFGASGRELGRKPAVEMATVAPAVGTAVLPELAGIDSKHPVEEDV